MRILIAIFLLWPVSALNAQTVNAACSALAKQYDGVNKDLAMNAAESSVDNSVPRITLSEIKNLNEMLVANIAVDLMKSRGCVLPDRAPSSFFYFIPAWNAPLIAPRVTPVLQRATRIIGKSREPSLNDDV